MESSWLPGGVEMFESIHVNELYPRWLVAADKGEAFALFDVRSLEEYQAGHVPGAKLIALNTLMARMDEFPKQGDVFMICRSGGRSAQAADYLTRQCGHKNLINIEGGTMAWIEAGYAIEKA